MTVRLSERDVMRSSAGVILVLAFLLPGCAAVSPAEPAPLPPATGVPSSTATLTPAPSVNASPTSCYGAFTWAYGSVPPEFITQIQEAMSASGLEGSVQASTFGENNGCGEYLVRDVDYHFTVPVPDLEANEDLAGKASIVLEIARSFVDKSPAPNLGNLQLTFVSGDRGCTWAYEAGAWNFKSGNAGNGACQAPTTEESRRLADVLGALAVDLACETSAVRADTLHAELDCERSQGESLYTVNVNLSSGDLEYAEACFHGWRSSEYNLTGDDPMMVVEGGNTYYERQRSFKWLANGILFSVFERINGGPDVTLTPEAREAVYLRAVQEGLIPGEGSDCQVNWNTFTNQTCAYEFQYPGDAQVETPDTSSIQVMAHAGREEPFQVTCARDYRPGEGLHMGKVMLPLLLE